MIQLLVLIGLIGLAIYALRGTVSAPADPEAELLKRCLGDEAQVTRLMELEWKANRRLSRRACAERALRALGRDQR